MTYYDIGPFQPEHIRPICKPAENVLLVDGRAFSLYKVAGIEPLPQSFPLIANAGALAAGAQVQVNLTLILNMRYGELGQFRMRVLDDVQIQVFQPAGQARSPLQNVFARSNAYTARRDEDYMTEFFILEQNPPTLTVTNPTGYALAQARIAFYGFRYILMGKGSAPGTLRTAGSSERIDPIDTAADPDEAKRKGWPFTLVPVTAWR